MNNNLINSNQLISKVIYTVLSLFFMTIFWFGRNAYYTNIELQNKIQNMTTILNKLTYTIDNTNYIISEFKNDIKEIKDNMIKLDREILILKTNRGENDKFYSK